MTGGNITQRWGATGAVALWPARSLALLLLVVAVLSVWMLEQRFSGLQRTDLMIETVPVTQYRLADDALRPLVVVAHGFGGSRQMMDQISVTLARRGFDVAAFDFPGHGRNDVPLSPDVSRIEGTTMQLVEVTRQVTQAMRDRTGYEGPVSLVGHSMATDVVIRAADGWPDVAGLVAISMYSEAVGPTSPQRLLIVSGAYEGHLRAVALKALRQVAPEAEEGQLARTADIARKAIVAPMVGHVGVLYSDATLIALSDWLADGVRLGGRADPDLSGIWTGLLVVALALLPWPVSRVLPRKAVAVSPTVSRKVFIWTVVLPVLPALGAMLVFPIDRVPFGGIAVLAVAFAVWGAVQLWALRRGGVTFPRPDLLGNIVYVVWGLGVFALALDRYGAAFVPTGHRLGLFLVMMLGTLPMIYADQVLLRSASIWRRIGARAALIMMLTTAMGLSPLTLGLGFTVLPVLVLFFLVYGSLAHWIAQRRGPASAAIGAGVALAWAIAASTPTFAIVP